MDQFLNDKTMSDQGKVSLTNDYVAEQAVEIGKVLERAVNHALSMHKRLGNPIATWSDGRVVIIPPEEIYIAPDVSEPNE